MTTDELTTVFRAAAERALADWYPEQWDRQASEAEDLSQDLWVWYLENASTQRKMQDLSEYEAIETARIRAVQLLSKQALAENTFNGRDLYSSDAVREALRGGSTNRYLAEVLPYARENLGNRNELQAEAIRRRYDDGVVPGDHADEMVLSRAVKSLTEEVNVFYITSDHDGVGSSSAVFPESRKQQGGYSDPTGNTAVLLDEHPEFRYHYLEQTPVDEFLGGAAALSGVHARDDQRPDSAVSTESGVLVATVNLMDPVFNGAPRSEMYRAQLFPELWPNEKPMLLHNWSIQDLEMFVGGEFTPGYGEAA